MCRANQSHQRSSSVLGPHTSLPEIELAIPGNEYGGTRFYVSCFWLGKLYGAFSLDVAFGEPQMESERVRPLFLADWLHSDGVRLQSYRLISREQHLAEKLHAYTIPRSTPNSRVRALLPPVDILGGEHAVTRSTHSSGLEMPVRSWLSVALNP